MSPSKITVLPLLDLSFLVIYPWLSVCQMIDCLLTQLYAVFILIVGDIHNMNTILKSQFINPSTTDTTCSYLILYNE